MKKNHLFANSLSGPGIALSCLMAIAGAANAVVTINTSNPQVYATTALTGFETLGGGMAGMAVSVTFGNSIVQSATWETVSPAAGGATLAGWFSLSQSGDTFNNAWTLTNLMDPTGNSLSITAFKINARPGDTVFDIEPVGFGTDGSFLGRPFQFASGGTDAEVSYWDALRLTSDASPVGDLFLQMEVALGENSFVAAGSSMSFFQDTDSVRDPGDISAIPEPGAAVATALLIGAGMGIRRRKQ